MCSDAQIFILLGFFLSELGSRATDDSATVPRKEGEIEEKDLYWTLGRDAPWW